MAGQTCRVIIVRDVVGETDELIPSKGAPVPICVTDGFVARTIGIAELLGRCDTQKVRASDLDVRVDER